MFLYSSFRRGLVSALNIVGVVAESATALGVLALGAQLVLLRRQTRAEFERRFVERYESIIANIPLKMLIGDRCDGAMTDLERRAFYDYFRLCEEEIYFLQQRKVSYQTWADWWVGIRSNLDKAAFRSAWAVLINELPESEDGAMEFELLRQVVLAQANKLANYEPWTDIRRPSWVARPRSWRASRSSR
jgi:hypothetical protein